MEELFQILFKQLSLKTWSSFKSAWNLSQWAKKSYVQCDLLTGAQLWMERTILEQNQNHQSWLGSGWKRSTRYNVDWWLGNSYKAVHYSLNDLCNLYKLRSCYLKLLGNCVWKRSKHPPSSFTKPVFVP